MPATTLEEAIPKLAPKDREFAQSLLRGAERYGSFTAKQTYWVDTLIKRANSGATSSADRTEFVGDFKALTTLFDRASGNLKQPAVVLRIDGPWDMRISVAGGKSSEPGTLAVTDNTKVYGETGRYWGRIRRNGEMTYSQEVSPNARQNIQKALQAFAADPIGEATKHGRLTGKCCFCNKPLTVEKSVARGVGPDCARKWGLS